MVRVEKFKHDYFLINRESEFHSFQNDYIVFTIEIAECELELYIREIFNRGRGVYNAMIAR